MSAEIKYNMMLGLNKKSWFRNLVQGLRGMMTTDVIFYWRNMSLTCLIFTTEIYKNRVVYRPFYISRKFSEMVESRIFKTAHTVVHNWEINPFVSLSCSVSLLLLLLFICLLFNHERKNFLMCREKKRFPNLN